MKKYICELIGTFFLVFTIGATVINPGAGAFAPFAIGAVLAAMIYAGGHISGAHYNPAVTVTLWIRGETNRAEVIPYIVSQVVGSALAAIAVMFIKTPITVSAMEISVLPALLSELLFTFALCLVILEVATSKKTQGNSYYGIAIGLVVMAGIYSVGEISGGVFNPAVVVGIVAMGLSALENAWIYVVANFAGAVLAAVIFRFFNSSE